MELLTLDEAQLLMLKLRARCSELCKLSVVRQRQWYTEHPEVDTRVARIYELQKILGEDCFQRKLTPYEAVLVAELEVLCDEIRLLPKCPDGLSVNEDKELCDAMSSAERLRRRLPSTPKKA